MPRRYFLSRLAGTLGAQISASIAERATLSAGEDNRGIESWANRLYRQDCRIAGSQYCDRAAILSQLRPGDLLQLCCQADNPHDDRAIEVSWRERKRGYLPRLDNAAAASLLGRGHALRAEILGDIPSTAHCMPPHSPPVDDN